MECVRARALGERARRRSRRGFSVFELVVVMCVVAVVAAIAIPRLSGATQRYRADLAAQRVAADLERAAAAARLSGSVREIVFNVNGSSYTVSGELGLNNRLPGYSVNLGEDPYKARLVSVDFDGSKGMEINGMGVITNPGSVTVAVGTEVRTVIIGSVGKANIKGARVLRGSTAMVDR